MPDLAHKKIGESTVKPELIDEIHRLHWHQKWSLRDIARHLNLNRRTVTKYLITPASQPKQSARTSKLDAFHQAIEALLEQAPKASAVVILQHLRPLGYQGGISILKQYLHGKRAARSTPRAFVRVESLPGDRFEIDWGHFGSLNYEGDARKLYAFSLVECHSRMMYVEFTHSQCFETFVRCHIHAFESLGGIARELVYDNLATAVADHDGNLVRFHPRFLAFARQFGFIPRAGQVASPWEKGKVERAGIGYLRQNFWPLRQFRDLVEVNAQVRHWLDEIANVRTHRETREQLKQRFRPDCLRPLPALRPDYRDTADALVYKDIRLQFDANRYCVPAVARASAPIVSKRSCSHNVRQLSSPAPSNAWPPNSVNVLPCISANWLAPAGRCPVRSPNSTIWSVTTVRRRSRRPSIKPPEHAPSAPITSPTSCASSERPEMCSLPFASKIPG